MPGPKGSIPAAFRLPRREEALLYLTGQAFQALASFYWTRSSPDDVGDDALAADAVSLAYDLVLALEARIEDEGRSLDEDRTSEEEPSP